MALASAPLRAGPFQPYDNRSGVLAETPPEPVDAGAVGEGSCAPPVLQRTLGPELRQPPGVAEEQAHQCGGGEQAKMTGSR